jgi:hypothetical protein
MKLRAVVVVVVGVCRAVQGSAAMAEKLLELFQKEQISTGRTQN